MAQFDNVDKVLPNTPYDLAALKPGEGAQAAQDALTDELDIQLVDEEGEDLDADGGATVTLAPGTEEADGGFFANLVDTLPEDELSEIATYVTSSYESDKESRKDWEDAYVKGLDLLGLRTEDRTEPFQGATGVYHPVLNEAVSQFQAGAYKELIPANGPVNTKIIGKGGAEMEQKAQRVKDYMNYQIMYEMEEYEPEYDQMLYYLGLAGSAFKKVYRDEQLGRAVSKFVPAEDLIVPYTTTSLRTAERITHVIRMSKNEIRKLQVAGFYADIELPNSSAVAEASQVKEKYDKIEGTSPTYSVSLDDGELELLECHCTFDFESLTDVGADGEPTGIKLPYIVTVLYDNGEVLGVRRNWDEMDPKKRKREFFVPYKFTPGLGFYGFGLIHLLGNLSKTATSILRQLIDAGTLANLPGGFKTRGLRVANDQQAIQPGEWRDVDVPGNSLRESLMPLPYKEPSGTLFQLLGFAVQAAEKFVGTQELGIADGNKETPVGTTVALLERGTKVMSAVHKRLHNSLKSELKLLARVLAEDVPQVYPYEVDGGTPDIRADDFSPMVDVLPVSDPNIFSMAQRVVLAQEQLKLAQSAPELHNLYEAYRRMYSALGVQNIDDLLKPTPVPMAMNPAAENNLLMLVAAGAGEPPKVFPGQDHDAHIAAHLGFTQLRVAKESMPVYAVLLQHIFEHVAVKSEEEARAEMQLPPMQPPTPDAQDDGMAANAELQSLISQKIAEYTIQFLETEKQQSGGSEDPLVALKSRELDIREAQNKANEQEAQAKLKQTAQLTDKKIQSAEDLAVFRAKVSTAGKQNSGRN